MTRRTVSGALSASVFAAALVLGGCLLPPAIVREQVRPATPPEPNNYSAETNSTASGIAARTVAVDYLMPPGPLRHEPPPALLRPGMVVATEKGSAQGIFLSLFAAEPHAFVHTGIVAVEDEGPVVYEANGRLQASVGTAPVDRVTGGVERTPWQAFVRRHRYIALFEPPAGADADAIAAFARESHAARLPFDARFDLGDAQRMYCSEFTAAALVAGGAPPPRPVPLTPNPSLGVVLAWLGIETTELQTAGSVTDGLVTVARWSRQDTPAQVDAWFAARHELQRRFTADQRLGNVISYSPLRGLRFQPPVRDFLAAVESAAASWPEQAGPYDAALASRVRALADRYLGALPE